MAAKRDVTLQVTVRVPAATGENEVERTINAALDESPDTGLEWGDWEVGMASIVSVQRVTVEADEDED